MSETRLPRWPLLPIAAPAFVAIWSGWVGLGSKTGFGLINPLPGTPWSHWQLDTRITLPIGVEAYAAYAMWVWLGSRKAPARARDFAKWSAAGALLLGALGQVAFHLMEVAGIDEAPWWITTLVSSLPVAVVGMAAALHHLAATDEPTPTVTATSLATDAPTPTELQLQADLGATLEEPRPAPTAITRGVSTPPAGASVPAPPQEAASGSVGVRGPGTGGGRSGGGRKVGRSSNRDRALALKSEGLKNAEIARELGVSPQTVSGYKLPEPVNA